MNSCESIRDLMSEFIDGELDDGQIQNVESHLGECAACRDELQALRMVDQQLAKSLVIDDIDGKVLRAAAACDSTTSATSTTTAGLGLRVGIVAAIAASLLLAFFLWTRDEPSIVENDGVKPEVVETAMVAARLVNATGPVEIRAADEEQWRTVLPSEKTELPSGARVRTIAPASCEIQTAEQGKVRMDRDCEIVVNDSQQLELVSGKLWCSAPSDREFQINVPMQPQDGQPVVAMFTCPSKKEFQCESTPSNVSCSSPAGPESDEAPVVRLGEENWQVPPGQKIVVDRARQISREPLPQSANVWQLPLLAVSADTRSELSGYLHELLAPIGRTKVRHMNETQIRALGPAGAIPLLSFVLHEPDADLYLRRTAMRLAAETADESAIPILRELTKNQDEYIASSATRLLDKLAKS
ncbi:MAG: zf-HC2 domain-containing protein [Planctomycetota bacterium]